MRLACQIGEMFRVLLPALVGFAMAMWLQPLAAQQEPAQPAAAQAEIWQKHDYADFRTCVRCHFRPAPTDSTEWVRLKESEIWLGEDKHARAFVVLKQPRAEQMGRILQHSLGWQDADVTTKRECLSCHANWQTGTPKPDDRNLEFGVSCQSCHGPGKDYTDPHQKESWRGLTSAEKQAYGMIDVRNPLMRTTQCLSCHLGNVEQGKVLTHEMYAAGHPPLPGIEVETFCQAMPPHWQLRSQKSARAQELLHYQPEMREATRQVLLGAVVPLRESYQLFAAQLAANAKQHQGADFAQFDCYACHHELQSPSWRQARGYAGAPGRLQPRFWPHALLRSDVLKALGDKEAVDLHAKAQGNITRLQEVLNRRPLGDALLIGDPAQEGTLSSDLVSSLDALVERLSSRSYNQEQSLAILRQLAAPQSDYVPDYDSARQIAWSLRAIYRGLDPKPAGDESIQKVFEQLNRELLLDLTRAPKWNFSEQEIRAADAPPTGIEASLPEALAAIGQYDPVAFRQRLAELSELLK
jgi:hypothetical protein